MLTNRIVRALIGVVFAKAAVATSWYLYQKSLKDQESADKEGETGSDDLNALEATPKVHDLSPAISQVEMYVKGKEAGKAEAADKPKRTRRAPKAVEATPAEAVAPKSRRKVKLAPVGEAAPAEVSSEPKKAARKPAAKTTASTKPAARKSKAKPEA